MCVVTDGQQRGVLAAIEIQAHACPAQQHHVTLVAGKIGKWPGSVYLRETDAPAKILSLGWYADRLAGHAPAILPGRGDQGIVANNLHASRPLIDRALWSKIAAPQ